MKKVLLVLTVLVLATSCSSSKKELYKQTDMFVESLYTTYESYGLIGAEDNMKATSDSSYLIAPVGRLIIVKINNAVDSEEYVELEKDLKDHYEGNSRVKDVYINQGGTIVIDCRN
jgi:hypothetical protein